MKKQPGHFFLSLLFIGAALVIGLFVLSSTDYARRGIDRIVHLVATSRMEDWAAHIAEKHPDVILNFGKAPIPDEVLADLRSEAEMYGVKAFEIRPAHEPLGTLRIYARNTFSDPDQGVATAAFRAPSSAPVKKEGGLTLVSTPLKDARGRKIGEIIAVTDERKIHSRLTDAIKHILSTALAALGVILAIALVLVRRVQFDAQLRIHHVRDYDELTGLPNRHAFEDLLNRFAGPGAQDDDGRSEPAKKKEVVPFACITFGIEGLGKITCSEGHEGAGYVLRTLSGRFARLAHEHGAHIFRMERNEFTIILPSPESRHAAIDMAEKLHQEARRPLYWRGKSLIIDISVGITFFPENATTRAELVRQATLVRQVAKDTRTGIIVYDPKLDIQYNETANLERLLLKAARNCSSYFNLNFQPIVELENELLHGFETLLRLTDDEGNTVPPGVFIPLAEKLGLMDDIGAWVLAEACSIAAHWPGHLHVAVNLSPTQFKSGKLVSSVWKALEVSRLDPRRLELEVTESLMMDNWEAASEQLDQFRSRGVKIVLDDFGTGYSSMNYLWKFRFDKLKIDRSFTQAAFAATGARNILRSLLVMARSLQLPVVAEGIETLEQAVFLRKFRCNYGQGWYYGKPLKPEEVSAAVMRDWRRRHDLQAISPDASDIAHQSAAL